MQDYELKLLNSFPNSFINHNGEFIAHKFSNTYFILRGCDETDVKCKVLEWLSRAAFKATPYRTKKSNEQFHAFMLEGINRFLGTSFSEDDMETIYTYLGNGINHDATEQFVLIAGYDMEFFKAYFFKDYKEKHK